MPTKQAQIFLCHSHADKPFVRKLAGHLSGLDVHVWLDEWELLPGDSLHDCIGEALEKVAYVGVVLSPNSAASRWCQSELEQSLTREKARGKKVAIPLLYRQVKAPPFLAGRLYVDFSKNYFRALTQLAGFLHGLPVKEVAQVIDAAKPKNLEATVQCLEAAGWKGIRYIEAAKYERLRKMLRESGVNVETNEFELVVRPKNSGLGQKRSIPRRIPIKK